jgi:20S proteasome subunit alpha 2
MPRQGFFRSIFLVGISIYSVRSEGRYSFSLSTFDPTGKLVQVERALQAAAHGTPVVGIVRSTGIVLAAPQILPSPLMQDDGTSRFSSVTAEILVAHSGISADGRVVVAEAQRLANLHEYTLDEDIPIEIFLEELSLLFQEYTMKAGTRPFGTTLVIAHLPRSRSSHTPCFYRIDPSGAVTALGKCAVINLEQTNIREKLIALVDSDNEDQPTESAAIDDDRTVLARLLRTVIEEMASLRKDDLSSMKDMTILTACLPWTRNFSIRRHVYEKTPIEMDNAL